MTAAQGLAACPICGGVTLAPQTSVAPLLAVSDYLVERVLLKVGVLLTRGRAHGGSRALQSELHRRGVAEEHARFVCETTPALVDKAIALASDEWRIVALMLGDRGEVSARQVQAALSDYVHELVADRIPHSRTALRRRMHDGLGVELHDDALERISA